MTRDVIAFGLMAILVFAGVVLGLYLRHNSRDRTLRRQAEKDAVRRDERAKT